MAGPKTNTIKDFWYMVWQEKVEIIVMVTKLEEDGRVLKKIILFILKVNKTFFRIVCEMYINASRFTPMKYIIDASLSDRHGRDQIVLRFKSTFFLPPCEFG
jgi:hypothetical protein